MLHVLARVLVVAGGIAYWFVAACGIYLLFALLFVYHAVDKEFPHIQPRDVLRKELAQVRFRARPRGGGPLLHPHGLKRFVPP